jgi:hypothetical protein
MQIKENSADQIWLKRIEFVALSTWLITGLVLVIISYVQYGEDFRGYYAAATVLLRGGNPYEYQEVAKVLNEFTGRMGNNPYYYPPWFAWIFLPLTALKFEMARIVWLLLNYLLWNFGLIRLNKALSWKLNKWQLYGLFTCATFSFAWITWRYEQAGILVFVILVELIISIQLRRQYWGGLWLALLLIKPNITLIVAAGVGVWLIRNGQKRIVLLAILALVCLTLVSTAITPEWYKPFLEVGFGSGLTSVLDGPDNVVGHRINSTFPDWLAIFGIARQFRYMLYGLYMAVGIVFLFRLIWISQDFLQVVSGSVLASFALTPYALQYDFPALIFILFWCLQASLSRPQRQWASLLGAGFVFSVIFWQQNISWAYWMIVGLIFLYFYAAHSLRVQVLPKN